MPTAWNSVHAWRESKGLSAPSAHDARWHRQQDIRREDADDERRRGLAADLRFRPGLDPGLELRPEQEERQDRNEEDQAHEHGRSEDVFHGSVLAQIAQSIFATGSSLTCVKKTRLSSSVVQIT